MQTGVTAGRLTTAAHLAGREIITAGSSVIVADQRIRNWATSTAGVLTQIATPSWVSASAVSGTGNTVGWWYYFTVCSLSASSQSTASIIASASALGSTPNSARFGVAWNTVAAATAYRGYKSSGYFSGTVESGSAGVFDY